MREDRTHEQVRERVPSPIVVLATATALLCVALYAMAPITSEVEARGGWDPMSRAVIATVALLMLLRRSRSALLWSGIAWSLALGPMIAEAALFLFRLSGGDAKSSPLVPSLGVRYHSSVFVIGAIEVALFLLTSLLILILAKSISRSPAALRWLKVPVEAARGFEGRAYGFRKAQETVKTLFGGAAIFGLWFGLAVALADAFWQSPLLPDALGNYLVGGLGNSVPFLLALGFMALRAGERLEVDDAGVRLFVYRPMFTLAFISWQQIQRVDEIRRGSKSPAFVLHFRAWLGVPTAIVIDPQRYQDEQRMLSLLRARLSLPGWAYKVFAPSRTLIPTAWGLVLLGLLFSLGMMGYSGWLMMQVASERASLDRLDHYAGLMWLPALNWAAVASFGLALGLMSASRRAGPRPGMMALWVIASPFVPGPIIHMLVWIAVHAILTARLAPITPHEAVPVPPAWQWDQAFLMMSLVPLLAGLSYLLGVTIGHRPLKLSAPFVSSAGLVPRGPSDEIEPGPDGSAILKTSVV